MAGPETKEQTIVRLKRQLDTARAQNRVLLPELESRRDAMAVCNGNCMKAYHGDEYEDVDGDGTD